MVNKTQNKKKIPTKRQETTKKTKNSKHNKNKHGKAPNNQQTKKISVKTLLFGTFPTAYGLCPLLVSLVHGRH